jgi:hypothetical protein
MSGLRAGKLRPAGIIFHRTLVLSRDQLWKPILLGSYSDSASSGAPSHFIQDAVWLPEDEKQILAKQNVSGKFQII